MRKRNSISRITEDQNLSEIYKTIADLPPAVKDSLPTGAAQIYLAAFNSALKQYDDESKAAATAWAAVKTKYKKVEDQWVAKETKEAGQSLVSEGFNLVEGIFDEETRTVEMTLIQAGWSKNNNYYAPERLQEIDALIPSQLKMFDGHLAPGKPKHERKNEEWWGTILEHHVEGDRLKAKVLIHNDDLWRKAKSVPQEVGGSVDLQAKVSEGEADGRKGRIIEQVMGYNSTDFVLFPAAGGRVERIAASVAWPTLQAAMDVAVTPIAPEPGKPEPEMPHDLKTMIAMSDKEKKLWESWWKLQDAFNCTLRAIARNESMEDADRTAAFGQLFDDYKQQAMSLDLTTLNGEHNMMYSQPPVRTPGGKGVEEMEIKSLADMLTAFPQFCEELKTQTLAVIKGSAEKDKMATDLMAATESIAKLEKDLTEAKKIADEYAAKEALAAKKALAEKKITDAKLVPEVVTEVFRNLVNDAKDEKAMDVLVADRVALQEKIQKSNVTPAGRPAIIVSADGNAPSVTDDRALAILRRVA